MQLSPSTKNICIGWASIALTVLGTAAFIHLSGGIAVLLSYFGSFRVIEHIYLAMVVLERVEAQYYPTNYLSSKESRRILEGDPEIVIQDRENNNENQIKKISFDLNKIKKEVAEEVGFDPEKISIHLSAEVFCQAYAMGSSNAGGIEVTQGLLEQFALQSDYNQTLAVSWLKGILIHEMSHLKHNDDLLFHVILTINELSSVFIGHVLGFGLIKKFITNVIMTKFTNIFFRSREHYADEMMLECGSEHKEKFCEGLQIMDIGDNNIAKNESKQLEADLPKPVMWLAKKFDNIKTTFLEFSATHPETKARIEHLSSLQEFNNSRKVIRK